MTRLMLMLASVNWLPQNIIPLTTRTCSVFDPFSNGLVGYEHQWCRYDTAYFKSRIICILYSNHSSSNSYMPQCFSADDWITSPHIVFHLFCIIIILLHRWMLELHHTLLMGPVCCWFFHTGTRLKKREQVRGRLISLSHTHVHLP